MTKRVLIPIPKEDFYPTESAIPWKILKSAGVEIVFATPTGSAACCDDRMLYGRGLGLLSGLLAADKVGRESYREMSASSEIKTPITWRDIYPTKFERIGRIKAESFKSNV